MTRAHDEPAMAEQAELTIAEAAAAANVNPRTIRRHLANFPGAHRTDGPGSRTGQWLVPTADLVAAGFNLNTLGAASLEPPKVSVSERMEEIEALKGELAEWRRRAEVAEARAEERERVIEAQAAALHALDRATMTPALIDWRRRSNRHEPARRSKNERVSSQNVHADPQWP